ncbi:MAG: tRNA pseudouridine synthase A [Clostridia bacterium]|nr:tRNA pseudouridine synthase A [Clostridia bacterium]
MNRNLLLTIEYDGTEFCGWQRQPDKRTVQGEIERVLSVICAQDIKVNGTSRTDAGVHALGQRASFGGDFGIPTDRIAGAANNLLNGGRSAGKAGDVRITEVREMPEEFHARYDAKGKKYIYKIRNAAVPDTFRRNYCYQIARPLDIEKMCSAAEFVRGTHDFKCFQAAGGEEKETTVRTIYDICIFENGKLLTKHASLAARRRFLKSAKRITKKDGILLSEREISGTLQEEFPSEKEIEIHVAGDGFLYNMVRIIVGTLVDVGLGKIEPEDVEKIIEGKDRQAAGHTAPPQGLYLAEVYYDVLQCHE